MALQAGLFDDSPRSREIIYSFMRLRALRVEADVKLALGEFSIEQAANYLQKTVPMDEGTARWEAAFFASAPGQAISYQIGKLLVGKAINFAPGVGVGLALAGYRIGGQVCRVAIDFEVVAIVRL